MLHLEMAIVSLCVSSQLELPVRQQPIEHNDLVVVHAGHLTARSTGMGDIDDKALREGKVSHILSKMWIDGASQIGMGEVYVLNTDTGRRLNTYLRSGAELPVSSRAYGKYRGKTGDGAQIVDEGSYKFETFDFVQLPGIAHAVYQSEPGWMGVYRGFVARAAGQAVAIVAIVASEGALGVYSLGTRPEFRRQGYGEALMRAALDQIRHETGAATAPVILQSTQAGYELYRRMGFRDVTRFTVFLTA